jgi:hypothetical protein
MRGLEPSVDLYAVAPAAANDNSSGAWQTYQRALHDFERGKPQEAANQLVTIDPTIREVPSRFLMEHVQRELAYQKRRRSTDKRGEVPRGVIVLNTK